MKTNKLLAVLLGLGLAGSAMAASPNATVGVSAKVVGVCMWVAGTNTVAFSSLDPSVGGSVPGTVVQPKFWCTNGAKYTIVDDNGANKSGTKYQMKHDTLAEYIPYTFSYTSTGSGLGKSTAISMNITASVAEIDYIDASEGTYSDTVTLTITP
ncbi:MAG: spore coat protein U domain-containing protein [Ramlibacter sp.]